MGDIRTPSSAKGSRALKILRKTAQSVYAAKLPPRSLRNVRHSHALTTARHIKRIDRQPWEERVANILLVLEEQRYGKANALHSAMDKANQAVLDVSKQKADLETHAEELTAANEEMRAANEEMRATNEEMRATNEELRAVSEELERMHTDVELFTPLALKYIVRPVEQMAGEMGRLLNRENGGMNEAAAASLTAFSKTAAAVSAFTSGMVRYWQVELEGKTFETADCEKLLLQVLLKFQDLIQRTNAVLTHDALPMLEVDSGQFETLLTVLIENAIRFNDTGSPEVHISATDIEHTDVEIPEPRIETGWLFGVSDNGPGIQASDTKRMFNVFETLGRETAGLGMGLAVAWRIVKRHGGNIWVTSKPDSGTCLYFTLPSYDSADG